VKKIRAYHSESARYIAARSNVVPRTAVILGSGLGEFADILEDPVSIGTAEVPHYPRLSVEGHKGRIVIGTLRGTPLLVFQGRIHYYETGMLDAVLYPILVAKELGVETLLITNAAGGIRSSFRAGDLMLMTDHINLTFEAPPAAANAAIERIPLYDTRLRALIERAARREKIPLRRGVYCGLTGPSYETAAEIRMIRNIGGDAVGMSTVNEVTCAVGMGMAVAGISCITNLSTGMTGEKLSHAEVTVVADSVKHKFTRLVRRFVASLPSAS
jgi:purine-nucleoside phosphorylase